MSNPLIQNDLIEVKLSNYATAPATGLNDPALLPLVRQYKRQVASRLFPLSQPDIDRKLPDAEYHVSRKIDGEFSVIVYRDGHLLTLNPGGTVRMGLPFLDEAKKLLDQSKVEQAVIAGELYVTNDENRRPRVHDVVSVARQPKSAEDLLRIRFAVFDIISINGDAVESDYADVWQRIEETFKLGESVHPVETVKLKGRQEVETQFEKWVEDQGAEGIVARSDSAGNFKIKPRHNIDAVVIGFTESTDDRQGMLHDLLLGVARGDGSVHALCRVGGGFPEEKRRELLSDLQDIVVDSEYAEVNSDHVAYQMVEPKWVVEISLLDLIAQNTRGGSINRMVLNWNKDASTYEVVRRLPLVSVISPQFVRIREDKSFNSADVRISQVTDIVPVAFSEISVSEMEMEASTVEQREVYVKTLKGQQLVRKFVRWKTNKVTEGGDFPAHVVHYTDFSPTRKVPLAREVRVSNSEEQIKQLYQELKDANIKKGWTLYEPGS